MRMIMRTLFLKGLTANCNLFIAFIKFLAFTLPKIFCTNLRKTCNVYFDSSAIASNKQYCNTMSKPVVIIALGSTKSLFRGLTIFA